MTQLDSLGYLKLSKAGKFGYNLKMWFVSIPSKFKKLGIGIWHFFKKLGLGIYNFFKDIVMTFVKGSWVTRLSYVICGFGSIVRGQIGRGILFLALEGVFIWYMIAFGGPYLSRLYILGTNPETENSFKILLYGVLTIFFILAFIYTWYQNIKQNRINEEIIAMKKKVKTTGDDLRELVDKNFYKTLLALPTLGIFLFTVMPIVFMILVAFTNYNADHQPPENLFGWVGWDNFATLFSWNVGGVNYSAAFGEVLLWTLIWAFFATFTNYFIGMLVAMLINKKGIKLKKLWRTILVFSIAVPQFISLLYISKLFGEGGFFTGIVQKWDPSFVSFWADPWCARITVVIINIWIGIPFVMLITTGILMNIPQDLYESSQIDGATGGQQYFKITLPYMLFVTGPYLLTSFTGNMNNFNVIYLITGGGPKLNSDKMPGSTDLLITWLYSLTVNDKNYALASVIGILVFIVVAVISLVVYNLIPSTKNEEEFQ